MERSRRILPLASALVALLTILAAGPGPGVAAGVRPAAQGIRALVRTGDPAPGGGRLRQLSDPSLNNRGDLAFGALTTNPHASAAVYMLSRGRLVTLASAGQPAPTGGVFRAFSDIILNDRGTVVFLGRKVCTSRGQGRSARSSLSGSRPPPAAPSRTSQTRRSTARTPSRSSAARRGPAAKASSRAARAARRRC